MMRLRRTSGAFTLIELLVTVAIVGLLIGILLPVLASARRAARAKVCLSNIRQIAVAVNAFSASNRGRLPENRTLISPDEHITWRLVFQRDGYIPTEASWRCPDHPAKDRLPNEIGLADSASRCVGDVPSGYALNGHLLWRLNKTTQIAERSDGAIARPSHTILITETAAVYPDLRVLDSAVAQGGQTELGGDFGYWHSRQGHYAFQDGHAEALGFLATGDPDCRWHNVPGPDLSPDPFVPTNPALLTQHGHPDWRYLVHPVYLAP